MGQLYYKGQRLVCIAEDWWSVEREEDAGGPAIGETVTCDGYHPEEPEYLYLVEHADVDEYGRDAYNQEAFVPEQRTDAKAELLNSFKEVKEGADGPVRVKEFEKIENRKA